MMEREEFINRAAIKAALYARLCPAQRDKILGRRTSFGCKIEKPEPVEIIEGHETRKELFRKQALSNANIRAREEFLKIIEVVSEASGFSVENITGPGATQKLSYVRFLCAYLDSNINHHATALIGGLLNRDRTTIRHGLRVFQERRDIPYLADLMANKNIQPLLKLADQNYERNSKTII